MSDLRNFGNLGADQASHAAERALDVAGHTYETAGVVANHAGGVVLGAAGVATAFTADTANAVSSAVSGAAGTSAAFVSNHAGEVGGFVTGAAGQVGGFAAHIAGEAGSFVTGAAGNAGGAISHAAGEAATAVSGTAGQVGEFAAGAAGNALDAVRNAAIAAPTYAIHAFQQASPLLSQAAGTVASTGAGLLGAAGEIGMAVGRYAKEGIAVAGQLGGQGLHAAAQVGHDGIAIATRVGGQGLQFAEEVGGKGIEYGGQALNTIGQAGSSGISFVAEAAGKIPIRQWDSAAVAGLAAAVHSLSVPLGKLFDWVRFDVLISFWQVVSLFFASIVSEAIARAKAFFGNVANLFSMDWSFTIPAIPPVVIFSIIAVSSMVLLCCFCCAFWRALSFTSAADEIRRGPDAKTWALRAKENKRSLQWIKYSLLAALSLYLPLSRICIQVFTCDPGFGSLVHRLDSGAACTQAWMPGEDPNHPSFYQKTFGSSYVCDCKSWAHYNTFLIISSIVFVIYTIAFPFMCWKLVKDNVPRGSTEDPDFRYDEDGNKVRYTDAMYRKDLETDPRYKNSPFLILYDGYERKGKYYKLLVMLLKLCLVVPVIVLWDRVVPQVAICLAILGCFAVYSSRARPFIDPVSDMMEIMGKAAAFFTALFGLIGSAAVAPNSAPAMGILINIVNSVNFAVMIVCFLLGVRAIRQILRKSFARNFEYSDTVLDLTGNVKAIVGSGRWDLRLETKHRIWTPFWDVLLGSVLNNEEVAARLYELKFATQDTGKDRIVDHFKGLSMPGREGKRKWVQANLEGVDVYWEGKVDGGSETTTRFGRMYVKPYPFCCVVVFDEGSGYSFIHDDLFEEFAAQNNRQETLRRRNTRQQLRCLNGENVTFTFDRWETHTVQDGTEEYKDNDGSSKTRTRYSSVQVHMYYSHGTLSVAQKRPELAAEGFAITVTLRDGRGTAVAPHTNETKQFENQVATIGHGELGITPEYAMTEQFSRLLGVNQYIVSSKFPAMLESFASYRRDLINKRMAAEGVLLSAFWLHVYDADTLPRAALEYYFTHCELNPIVRDIPVKYKNELDYLYGQMTFVRHHPCASLWFVFFDDIWRNNKDIFKEPSAEAEPLLNPARPTSLAYTPIPREALEKQLQAVKLLYRSKLFTPATLDTLYAQLAETEKMYQSTAPVMIRVAPAAPVSEFSKPATGV